MRMLVAVRVRTSDGNAAIGRLLAARGMPHRSRDNTLIVPAPQQAALRFASWRRPEGYLKPNRWSRVRSRHECAN